MKEKTLFWLIFNVVFTLGFVVMYLENKDSLLTKVLFVPLVLSWFLHVVFALRK